jgi:putative hydrolase of the HAD superfamily
VQLPRAILFDPDDAILSAYSRPELAWLAVSEELPEAIAPVTPQEAAEAVPFHHTRCGLCCGRT